MSYKDESGGTKMTVGGVSGGSGFLQVNQMVSRIGEEKAAMYMERSKSH